MLVDPSTAGETDRYLTTNCMNWFSARYTMDKYTPTTTGTPAIAGQLKKFTKKMRAQE